MIENYGNVRAVLNELRLALKNLRETGETYSIYIEKIFIHFVVKIWKFL